MNPNQQPPGGYPPGQYPHYPPMYPPQMGQQHPHFMQQATPQYPAPATPYMNVPMKQEPQWNQMGSDGRYGMAGPSMGHNYPYGAAPMPMPGIEMGRDARESDPYSLGTGVYMPPQPQPQSSNNSLLAQHLAAGPIQQQPTHLHQLLQQPVFPGATNQQHVQMQMMQEARIMEFEFQAMRAQQSKQQQELEMQHQMMRQQQFQQQQMAAYMAQQQQQQHQQQEAQARAAYYQPDQNVNSAFPPSVSSTQSAFSIMKPQEMLAQPSTYEYYRPGPTEEHNLDNFSTGELCIFGRELVAELSAKTSALSQMLKKVMEKKSLNQGENPNELAEQCRATMDKMSAIREVIEKRRDPGWQRLTGDDYIELMLDDSELEKGSEAEQEEKKAKRAELEKRFPVVLSKTAPNEGDVWYQGRWISEALHQKYLIFETNKIRLKEVSNKLKSLAWRIEVTSPGHLKKVDQTKISRKRPEDPVLGPTAAQ